MTTPIERTLAVIRTRKYLWERLSEAGLPEEEMQRIKGLLRHYPSAQLLELAVHSNRGLIEPMFDFEADGIHGESLKEAMLADRKIPE